jgi:hypothetical protein
VGLALLVLLYAGFVIGVLACGMGLYFLVLKITGVHKLGDVPGIGEFGTLQAGSSLVMIGAYCFYYSLATYLPLQNGAVLQSRVDKLVVDTSRDLRKEYTLVRNAHADPIGPEHLSRASFLVGFLQRIDEQNGHAFYFNGEIKRRAGKRDESHQFYYRYLEQQVKLKNAHRDGGTGAEICYERPHGYCAQRSGWIHHLLANDFYNKGLAASDRAEKRVHFEQASKHADESLEDFPDGFVQEKPTRVLRSLVAEELKRLGEP